MAIIVNDNFAVNTGKPIDSKYLNITQPWTSTSAVNSGIPLSYRYSGLTVNIMGTEYWYHSGIADINLIIKNSGGSSTITGATNGLGLSGTNIKLGGTLTGNTIFNGGASSYNLRYAADYSSNYINRSLVDAGYVTGKTNTISLSINNYTGTTIPNTYYNKTQINNYTGSSIVCRTQRMAKLYAYNNFT